VIAHNTLRDAVLDVYDGLKQRIDSGELVDAWVTDAYIGPDGGYVINTHEMRRPVIREINIDVVLTR
jgi:hypothetical protein